MSFKVRHYRSRIYNPIKKKIIKALLAVFAAGIFFTLGWLLYEPLMKSVTEKNKEILEESPVSVPETLKKEDEIPLSFTEKKETVMTVPEESLYSAIGYYEFLNSLPDYVTGIVIDLKTSEGTVTYKSSQVSVNDAGAVSENAVDMELRIETARKLGYDVVARIYAFEDHTAPYSSPDLAIRYENEDGVLWLDDSYDDGGKPWMNPYSDTAQKYVMDIVYDAEDMGFDAIILDGMRFPGETGQQYAYYGDSAETVSRSEVLSDFAKRIYEALSGGSTDIIICYDAYEAITGGDIYGGSPAVYVVDALSPEISLTEFIGKKINSEFYYKVLPDDVSEMVGAVYDLLGYATDRCIMPRICTDGLTEEQFETLMKTVKSLSGGGIIIEYDSVFFGEKEEVSAEETEEELTTPEQSYYYVPSSTEKTASETEPVETEENTESDSESRNIIFG